MKFALAFTALASAANDQAPVISLNLDVHLHPQDATHRTHLAHGVAPGINANSFADECEVEQNQPAGVSCEEPEATAKDVHDGAVLVQTVYTLFVKSDPLEGASPNQHQLSEDKDVLDLRQRGEWIIKYDATDADNNSAEQLTFALILKDEEAPGCGTQKTAKCYSGTSAYRNFDGVDTLTMELCDNGSAPESMVWLPETEAFTMDLYDGQLTHANSIYQSLLKDAGGAVIPDSQNIVPSNLYTGKSEPFELAYEIRSEDFAGIFGLNNGNNVYDEQGKVILTDTINPLIADASPPASWECGYLPTVSTYRLGSNEAYTDCYDNWSASQAGTTFSKVDIKFTSLDHGSNIPFDDGHIVAHDSIVLSNEAIAVFGSESNVNTQAQPIVLTYTVSDNFGNEAIPVTTTVQLQDTLFPTLYITQAEAQVSRPGDNVQEEGDACLGDLNVATEFTKEHCDEFSTWTDGVGESAKTYSIYTHSEQKNIHDGSNPYVDEVEIYHSAGYTDDYAFLSELVQEGVGYECFDACSETTTQTSWKASCAANAADGPAFDSTTVKTTGSYYLHYECNDFAGQKTTACRTIINEDKTRPVITVSAQANRNDGNLVLEATRDLNYVDDGATCSDNASEELISQNVVVSGDVVDMTTPGTYVITYSCTDSGQNEATTNHRSVVIVDTSCPTCTVIGYPIGTPLEENIEASFPYVEDETTCTDTLDGDRGSADITGDDVDVEAVATYHVTYSVTDSQGNGGVPGTCAESHKVKIVNVVDTLNPHIDLTYKNVLLNGNADTTNTGYNHNNDGSNHLQHNLIDNPNTLMAESESSSVNGWVIGAIASAVSGVALLGYAATRKSAVATSVPV